MRKLIKNFSSLSGIRAFRLFLVMFATGVALLWRGYVKTNPGASQAVFAVLFVLSLILLILSFIFVKSQDD